MKNKIDWIKVMYITGIVALIGGILDPLEGSVVIAAGGILVTLSAFRAAYRHRKLLLISSVMIVLGVFFLFYLSSLGGFGGTSDLSWWYGTLILPYPAGWIMSIVFAFKGLSAWRKNIL